MTFREWRRQLETWHKVVLVLAGLVGFATCAGNAAQMFGFGPIPTTQSHLMAQSKRIDTLRTDVEGLRSQASAIRADLKIEVDALRSDLEPLLIDLCLATTARERAQRRLRCEGLGVR